MKQFFTPRREGAKRTNESKDRKFFGHTIGDAFNAMLDQVFAEVDKEAESLIHQPQVGQDLLAVDRIECNDRLDFHDYAIVDDQVSAEAFVERDSIPCDRNDYLPFHYVTVFAQFMHKQDFVYDFEDTGPESGMQAVGRVNHPSRDFILFHAAKLVLLLLICEAKNLGLRDSFQGAKAQRAGTKPKYPGLAWVDHPRRGFIPKPLRLSVFA
jgi:hypothetical protein